MSVLANSTQVIELDCAPGGTRPGDLIAGVVKGTILEGMPEAHPDATTLQLMGAWSWEFPNVTPEQWADVQKVIEPRIRALYAAGTIRFGSWG